MPVKEGDILIFPFRKLERGISCLYKLTYLTGYEYIGMTNDLSRRLGGHRSGTIRGTGKVFVVRILKIENDYQKLKKMEKACILENNSNPMLINLNHRSFRIRLGREIGELEADQLCLYLKFFIE